MTPRLHPTIARVRTARTRRAPASRAILSLTEPDQEALVERLLRMSREQLVAWADDLLRTIPAEELEILAGNCLNAPGVPKKFLRSA